MRWAGMIGYSRQTEVKPGVWEDNITEARALGDVQQTTEVLRSGEGVHATHGVTTSISVVTDGSRVPFKGMVYITYLGTRYTIASVVVQPPRMVFYLGEEYRGPAPGGSTPPP